MQGDRMEPLISAGGFCAPHGALSGRVLQRGDLFYVTYRVRNPLRRWWWRHTGWSTEWTVEHVYVPLVDQIPSFTATRGGIRSS